MVELRSRARNEKLFIACTETTTRQQKMWLSEMCAKLEPGYQVVVVALTLLNIPNRWEVWDIGKSKRPNNASSIVCPWWKRITTNKAYVKMDAMLFSCSHNLDYQMNGCSPMQAPRTRCFVLVYFGMSSQKHLHRLDKDFCARAETYIYPFLEKWNETVRAHAPNGEKGASINVIDCLITAKASLATKTIFSSDIESK